MRRPRVSVRPNGSRAPASPLYDGHIIYNEDLAAIKLKKKELVLNKPIYAGMCILDLSKRHMYEFHYDVIKPKYGAKAKLLFTDTDSLWAFKRALTLVTWMPIFSTMTDV